MFKKRKEKKRNCGVIGAIHGGRAAERESEKLPDMPALRQEDIVSTERDLGPSVPTILVIAGKKLCDGIHPRRRNQTRIRDGS